MYSENHLRKVCLRVQQLVIGTVSLEWQDLALICPYYTIFFFFTTLTPGRLDQCQYLYGNIMQYTKALQNVTIGEKWRKCAIFLYLFHIIVCGPAIISIKTPKLFF